LEGDILLAYDEHPTPGIDDLHLLLTGATLGVASKLTILRGLEKRTLFIVPEDSARNS
jgi:hypothetical protein